MKKKSSRITILIPCHNEEDSISSCIKSCLSQTRKLDEILIVNDGSSDTTPLIIEKLATQHPKLIKIVNIAVPTGNKSYAQERGLREVTGDICIFTDGDTILDPNFVKNIEQDFTDPKVDAVSGYVKSIKNNWLTECRSFDYVVGQNIHKLAQHYLDFILVIPGAAGAFRTKLLRENLTFNHDTLTEDLDLTYQLHKKGYFIKYDQRAITFTQDPGTLHSYINQMRRWYGGGWQNLIKHLDKNIFNEPSWVLELTLIYVEGLIYSLILFLLPIINLELSLKVLLVYFFLICLQAIYAAYKEKRFSLLTVPVVYIFVMFINSAIYLEQFFLEVILHKNNLTWFQPERVKI